LISLKSNINNRYNFKFKFKRNGSILHSAQ
jgi:hypothetical protein